MTTSNVRVINRRYRLFSSNSALVEVNYYAQMCLFYEKNFLIPMHSKALVKLFLLIFLGTWATSSVFGQVQGKVYRDFNANGVFDSTATYKEVGLSGITVTAYNAAGTSVGTATTNATGNYTIPSVSGALRVEFTLPIYYFPSKGSSGNSSIQFVTASNALISLKVS